MRSSATTGCFPPVKRFSPTIAILAWSFLLSLAPCNAQTLPTMFQGPSIPLPPAQDQPWTPPQTKLSPATVSAITELFKDGMADPRGCEYREIEVITGQKPRDGASVKTHGWLMPAQGDQKFAVCWNGAVYPVISVGAPVDLEHDVSLMLKNDLDEVAKEQAHWDAVEVDRKKQAELSGQTYTHVNWGSRWDLLRQEDQIIAWNQLHPIKAALLLRLGKASLAEEVWHQWYCAFSGKEPDDPYLPLVDDWAYSLFVRAAWAHFNGEDHLALASAQALLPLQQAGTASAAAKKLVAGYSGMPQPYLRFLDQIPSLIADEQQRVNEASNTPVLQLNPQPQGPNLVKGLVHDLELVNELPDSSPGAVNPMNSPIVQALVKQGDAAVEPLLSCYENDDRLTRSLDIDFGKPSRSIGFIDVRWMAYVAICNILHVSDFGEPSKPNLSPSDRRHDDVERMRAYWQRSKGKSQAQVAYDTLNNDQASPGQWAQAVYYLVEPSNVVASPGSSFGYGSWATWPLKPGETAPMRGEPLRSLNNPSISDLMVKRLKQVEDQNQNIQTYMYGPVCNFATALAKWDGKAHLDDLKAFTKILEDRFNRERWESYATIGTLTELLDKRISWGDPDAASEYSAMVVGWDPNTVQGGGLGFLDVISHHPDNPVLGAAAEKLFSDPSLGWIDPSGNAFSSRVPIGTLRSPLIAVPAFRAVVLRALHNQAHAGSFTKNPNGVWIEPWSGRGLSFTKDDPAPPSDAVFDFRICDIYANEISYLPGGPECSLFWPVEKRDKGVAACIAYLQRYGNNFRYDPNIPQTPLFGSDDTPIHFPILDQPATPTDVSTGRAIFSLSGSPRLVKMPLPVSATWTRRPDHPGGTVWQGEEILVDGTWQRFFGFTGNSYAAGESPMLKVPGSEIEFPLYRWKIGPGFEAKLDGPGETTFTEMRQPIFPKVTVGTPVPITLTLRNSRGADQAAPATFLPPTSDGKTLPSGITFTADYSEKLDPDDKSWTPLTLKPQPSSSLPPVPTPTVKTGQEITAMKVDLRDFFDLSRPGTYRLHATANPKNGAYDQADDVIFTIVKE